MNNNIKIRTANINDSETIYNFIKDLAIYEKLENEVKTSIDIIKKTVFGKNSVTTVLICELNSKPIGMALYFYNYSTWLGKNGIYLEDLYVDPNYRGLGAGRALLNKLAKTALEKDCGRVEWSCLDWNKPSRDFYNNIGAKDMEEWISYRLTGKALKDFANNSK